MSHKPGGGIRSKNVSHRTEPKVEPRAYGRNPAKVSQYGALVGNHITSTVNTDYRGEPDFTREGGYNAPVGPRNLAQEGPGAGREVMRSGGQGMHGKSNPGNPPAGGDVFEGWPTPRR